ncbi:hypothetical protein GDO81_000426 [Engystomops pustulosus]|uniref:Uncharacterized protein n=1 Tax=Engystomops pustulosus TaxID=76066 RepID=A0AAV7D5E3_ENGPU|nr:hypothetical protein GDO81_000426 [Engystomops pustulosus]
MSILITCFFSKPPCCLKQKHNELSQKQYSKQICKTQDQRMEPVETKQSVSFFVLESCDKGNPVYKRKKTLLETLQFIPSTQFQIHSFIMYIAIATH